MSAPSPRDIRRVYGRRHTRSLSPARQGAFEAMLSQVQIPPELLDRGGLTACDFFSRDFESFWFEIGFGNGGHLKDECQAHPDTAFIGAEPFVNGMAAFLDSMQGHSHDNIRVHMDDAMTVVDALADAQLDGIYILNPDPWPKKRHWKRRIVNPEHVRKFVRVLKPGGKLVMTTDVSDLADWMTTHAVNNPDLRWTAEKPEDWQTPPPGWLPTKYEKKGADKGRKQVYLVFEKRSTA
ncbi:MAG TPA: tRNA (guanosine(46)-N7)-methyltransferase TrmB [Micavibrio sp.]